MKFDEKAFKARRVGKNKITDKMIKPLNVRYKSPLRGYMTIPEMANYLMISRTRANNWIWEKSIPYLDVSMNNLPYKYLVKKEIVYKIKKILEELEKN